MNVICWGVTLFHGKKQFLIIAASKLVIHSIFHMHSTNKFYWRAIILPLRPSNLFACVFIPFMLFIFNIYRQKRLWNARTFEDANFGRPNMWFAACISKFQRFLLSESEKWLRARGKMYRMNQSGKETNQYTNKVKYKCKE